MLTGYAGKRMERFMKTPSIGFIAIGLLSLAGCANTGVSAPATLADYIAEADTAYRHLPGALPVYNSAVREICEVMQPAPRRNSQPWSILSLCRGSRRFTCLHSSDMRLTRRLSERSTDFTN